MEGGSIMSVNKNARRANKAIYVMKARNLHLILIKDIKKLKGTYKVEVTDDLLQSSKEVCRCAAMADSIYLHQFSPKTMFYTRKKYLYEALGYAKNIRIDTEILWILMSQGDDRFGDKKSREAIFKNWAIALEEVIALILKIIQSDEDRWKTWHPSCKNAKNLVNKNTSSGSKEESSNNLSADNEQEQASQNEQKDAL